MKKLLISGAIAAMLFAGSIAVAQTEEQAAPTEAAMTTSATAETAPPAPAFPIAELGNCASKDACHAYCEDSTHREACFTYAQTHGLMSKEKVAAARVILGKKGPGGCSSAESCRAYCTDSAHQEECLKFAQEKKIIGDDKVSLIKKLMTGEGPGACKSAESCRAYCAETAHQAECRAFAQMHNLGKKMGSTTPPMMRKMGSTTREMEKGMRLGSSTPGGMMPPRKLSSTTPGMNREMEMRMKNASGTGEMRKQMPPPNPGNRPPKENDDLGAALFNGLLRLLGR